VFVRRAHPCRLFAGDFFEDQPVPIGAPGEREGDGVMDPELREFLEGKFNAVDEKFARIDERFTGIDQKFEETKQYIDERFEETKRHVGVVAEGVRGDVRQVAEGHDVIRREIREYRDENEVAHQDLKASITFVSGDLDRRVRILEGNA
jgi:hypothetical protein